LVSIHPALTAPVGSRSPLEQIAPKELPFENGSF